MAAPISVTGGQAGLLQLAERLDAVPPTLRAFFNLAEEWHLTADEQIKLLGQPSRSTYFKWKKEGGQVSPDTLERISCVLGIYKALQILFPDPVAAREWLRAPNEAPMFGGRKALDLMLNGGMANLIFVRRYLDAQRGGW